MKPVTAICMVAVAMFLSAPSQAQIINPKKVLERKVSDKINRTIDKKTGEVVDSAFSTNNNKTSEPARQDKPAADKAVSKEAAPAANSNPEPALQVYSKFDFLPGEKVIFYEDFSQDNVGDFPALWNTNGSAEIVTNNLFPGKWMKFIGRKTVWTDALLTLPDNYTIEFDIIPTEGEEKGMAGYSFRLMQSINAKAWDAGAVPGKAGFNFYVEYFGRAGYRTYINSDEGQGLGLTGHIDDKDLYQHLNKKYHIAIWVQKSRVRLYQDENKIIDLPRAFPSGLAKMDRIRFEEGAAMVSNIRIAVGAPDMRNKLLTEGKIVSYGIYFDVNKDIVKPESYASLKEIATILTENPGIKIKVVGHTDSDGADAANLDLSKRRAASVKKELTGTFGIDASRIETDGKGETQPVAANDSPSNKALNRRVEFIKL